MRERAATTKHIRLECKHQQKTKRTSHTEKKTEQLHAVAMCESKLYFEFQGQQKKEKRENA